MSVKLLTEHHLEFQSLKVGCTGSSESTLVQMPHCWKSMSRLNCDLFIMCIQTLKEAEANEYALRHLTFVEIL